VGVAKCVGRVWGELYCPLHALHSLHSLHSPLPYYFLDASQGQVLRTLHSLCTLHSLHSLRALHSLHSLLQVKRRRLLKPATATGKGNKEVGGKF